MRRLACLAAFFALCAHAEVYKWVDEKGQVQYGEQPPASAAATKMKVPAAGTAEAPGEKPKEAVANKGSTKEERTARCDFEREQQKLLEAEAPVIYKDAKGEMVALDEAKRAAAKERVRDNVKKYCS